MNDQNLNIFNVIILVGVIHGIIFSLIILINKKFKSRTNKFLALTILSLAFSNLQYWLMDVDLYSVKPNFVFIPFEFLMLPFFYFFVKSYLEKKILIIEYYILLSLFFITILYQLIFTTEYFSNKLIDFLNLVLEYLSIVFSLTLMFIVFKTIIKYEKDTKPNQNLKAETKWLKKILILGITLCIIWFFSLNYFDFYSKGYYKFYPLWIGISILIYWVGYASIFKTIIYKDRNRIKSLRKSGNNSLENNINQKVNSFKLLEIQIINQKLYLNPNLNLKEISKALNLSEGYISQLINKNSNLNFNDYINELRVEDAKNMLTNPVFNNYTITSIGLEAGFNSKASFYRAFKKFTNKTPSDYKKGVSNL